MHYALFEVAADALTRATDIDDKENLLDALKTTKLADTVAGPLDWTAPVADGTARPNPNGVTTPVVGGQWVPGGKHMFDIVVVVNTTAPNIAIQDEMKPLEAFRTS
jgi:branched-chain amino acid transport system substrate-binding protein